MSNVYRHLYFPELSAFIFDNCALLERIRSFKDSMRSLISFLLAIVLFHCVAADRKLNEVETLSPEELKEGIEAGDCEFEDGILDFSSISIQVPSHKVFVFS